MADIIYLAPGYLSFLDVKKTNVYIERPIKSIKLKPCKSALMQHIALH